MRVIADLHVHSRFARACSPSINIASMETAAKEKGLAVVGTGDFLHPEWLKEMKANLVPDGESGLLMRKGSASGVRFILSN